MNRYICIHGHFYQPPRENPWLEEVEREDSAYPYHDWNERITAECYAPNSASRILDTEQRIIDIVSNYARMNFNFGPTLLSWMERNHPEVYQAILAADRESQERFSGHGSAIAQTYNHTIIPLADERDRKTQVIWGKRDFEFRFGRKPEGMWLPETAVDLATLVALAEQGIRFTVLAPHQAARVRKIGAKNWDDVSGGKIDPRMPYLCNLPGGKQIFLFFYDGPISHDISFGDLLESGEKFARRLLGAFSEKGDRPELVHVAADGETFGHHHRFGDMALSYGLHYIETNNLAVLTNYDEFLDKFPPTHEVEIIERTSWSCAHGVERWRDDCGCHTGAHPGWQQKWRKPLREGLEWLQGQLADVYELEAAKYVPDPWGTRDRYIEVILNRDRGAVDQFLRQRTLKELNLGEMVRVLKLMEMQRNAMLMFTSCGWFFDDISGIESVQVLRYAARAIQLAREVAEVRLEDQFRDILREAPANVADPADGSRVYDVYARVASVDLRRVGAHYAISSLFEDYGEQTTIYCFTANREFYEEREAGKLKLAIGKVNVSSEVTWEESRISFAVLHLGDHNVSGGAMSYMNDKIFDMMHREISEAFDRGDTPGVIRIMDRHFGVNSYSIWHLFRDEQRKILDQVIAATLEEAEVSLRQIFDNSYTIMNYLASLEIPQPRLFSVTLDYMLNAEIRKLLVDKDIDSEKLEHLVSEIRKWSVELDRATLEYVAKSRIVELTDNLQDDPESLEAFERIILMLNCIESLGLRPDLWETQNVYFSIAKKHYKQMELRADRGEKEAVIWVEAFRALGQHLRVKV